MEKISKILVALKARTDKGLVAWQETADDDTFQYSLPDSTMKITENRGIYYLSIIDQNGKTVDVVSSYELDRALGSAAVTDASSHRELMELLYFAARRKAVGGDATVDGILSRLGVEA